MSDDELERIDHIARDPAATAWRRAARAHQSAWRTQHGWPKGTQALGQGRGTRPIGSRIDAASGAAGLNFLNDATRRAVRDRLDHPQRHETLDANRLRTDLLSSMPMCFNLFGPLWDDPTLASTVTHRWFPDLCPAGAAVEVMFEWSPGRADARWLDDRTAFDVALLVHAEGGDRLIGIETKYHEYPITEPVLRRRAGVQVRREIKQRYRDVSDHADLFDDPRAVDLLWGTDVEQVWRDHLLALACHQQSDDITAVRYVLVAPAANPPWEPLADRYRALMTASARPTFEFRTIDDLIDTAADLLPHVVDFRLRYLDVSA